MFRTLRFYHSFFKFLSTPSARRATQCGLFSSRSHSHFYPRPPRGGRREQAAAMGKACAISIHALREEGDESRPPPWAKPVQFLSTPSARRATVWPSKISPPEGYFYPRPPRGGRLRTFEKSSGIQLFLSTPSARRATENYSCIAVIQEISIHALREESDAGSPGRRSNTSNFYPRPPRGERPCE